MRTCETCATEVDDDAAFCPSCGQPLNVAAPGAGGPPPSPRSSPGPNGDEVSGEPTAAIPPPGASTPAASRRRTGSAPVNMPITWPVTISGWLIGVAALVGALALLLDFRLFANPATILLLVLLVGVAATVFLSANVPATPHLRLAVLAVVFAGLGLALDRVGFGAGPGSAILLIATAAAAVGVVLLETGHDRPWAGPSGRR